jgi:hypothetical protein
MSTAERITLGCLGVLSLIVLIVCLAALARDPRGPKEGEPSPGAERLRTPSKKRLINPLDRPGPTSSDKPYRLLPSQQKRLLNLCVEAEMHDCCRAQGYS